jgi:hypothetical protein
MAEPDASQQHCELVKNFLARQSIILFAGVIFLAYTAIRVRRGLERRDLKTFCADVSKQAGQQGLGGVLMVLVGLHLAESGFDSLAWYGAQACPNSPWPPPRRCLRLPTARAALLRSTRLRLSSRPS